MRIYLDHCAYNRPFDDQSSIKIQLETSAKLYIQDQIKQDKYDLVWSYMSDFENNNNPNIENKKSIQIWEDIDANPQKIFWNEVKNLNKKVFV